MNNEKPLTEHEVQRICGKLVEREIIYNMSGLVSELTACADDCPHYIEDFPEIWQGPCVLGSTPARIVDTTGKGSRTTNQK